MNNLVDLITAKVSPKSHPNPVKNNKPHPTSMQWLEEGRERDLSEIGKQRRRETGSGEPEKWVKTNLPTKTRAVRNDIWVRAGTQDQDKSFVFLSNICGKTRTLEIICSSFWGGGCLNETTADSRTLGLVTPACRCQHVVLYHRLLHLWDHQVCGGEELDHWHHQSCRPTPHHHLLHWVSPSLPAAAPYSW